MATYCQAGDIARVTLPDGSIQNFPDTPINLIVSRESDKEELSFNSTSGPIIYNAPTGWEIYDFISSGSMRFSQTFPFVSGWYSYFEVIPDLSIYGTDPVLLTPSWMNIVGYKVDGYYKNKPGLLPRTSINQDWDTNYNDNSGTINITFFIRKIGINIKITGNSGTELFNQSYSTDNYSVECAQGCPPNTLDCGDCCLPCADTYNQISGIRALLSRIK
ncbi:hypothetical protein [Sphaerospermopsis sp. LEGE 08334]|uniref:hypothetical protein n=1 Tax=Sphaerospermopsis sp. LEGE 08334 TaxID=1828651 RepID=UPI001880912B|nr:hypothetical protein [Sphaerospermopsis sp. LEGE 08334]MBE9059355.1 hypothetical protein [Sphaerospermopsis sp. LEGE 08334]